MLDGLISIWGILKDYDADVICCIVVCIFAACIILLAKEYGKEFLNRLCSRRILPHLVFALLSFALILLMIRQNWISTIWTIVVFTVYILYIVSVFRSVHKKTWLVERYEKTILPLLESGHFLECQELLKKQPWYLWDFDERLEYKILKASCLRGLGNYTEAYEIYHSIQLQYLYPEELVKVVAAEAYTLALLGNVRKACEVADQYLQSYGVAYGALQSLLSEQIGNIEDAYNRAVKAEDSIPRGYRDHQMLFNLHHQMARMYILKGNLSEAKTYWNMAYSESEYLTDIAMLCTFYENYIKTLHRLEPESDLENKLLKKYEQTAMKGGVNNVIAYSNFVLFLTREGGNRQQIYDCIIATYRTVHAMLSKPEQYIIEVSALQVLNSENFDPSEVLCDIRKHFDDYFLAPMPMRANLLQGLVFPTALPEKDVPMFMEWGERLAAYGGTQAKADLDEYESTLSNDCVNEHCWVNNQRIDFERKSHPNYNGSYVLQLLRDNVSMYESHGNLLNAADEEVHMLNIYLELINLGQVPDDIGANRKLAEIFNSAVRRISSIPIISAIDTRVELAYYALIFGQKSAAKSLMTPVIEAKIPLAPNRMRSREVGKHLEIVGRELEIIFT